MTRRRLIRIWSAVALSLGLVLTGASPAHALTGDFRAHDPTIVQSGSCWYAFSTGDEYGYRNGNVQIRRSCGGLTGSWSLIGSVFPTVPGWITSYLGATPPNLWAPDVNLVNGVWHLYYSGSKFGTNSSVIGLATATNIEGPWTDRGEVLRSGSGNNYNAIDPEIAYTISNGARTAEWMVFGSFWDGIKMRRVDTATGKLSGADTRTYSLASRGGGAIEAGSIAWRNGFYYLFVSFDRCCAGSDSTYRTMVGRSTSITGPYVDRNGVAMMSGGGTQLLSSSGNVRGPGGGDVTLDGTTYRLAHHYYDTNLGGDWRMQIRDLSWSSDGWPTAGASR
ncbi:family 43 glycosylhydrolase [Modestobacter sp. I12A-02628]|uniref:Arabinan endo-1,5-alpha-L-arabinosidase n=1 Tax=Goekera deserti TaxID=2497753 RepID=A0A7K3WL56_9ACTN|nr:arabinan endo-1,5-alpha-L-arabinosidase [Goekera deserti]MPQ99980.1 family 43 glycosylhydrolase [Goekera deserti]NDI49759.1 family 43 glycosylhydrolase [Goekera deserti]NEL56609.1 arabinan endo-1,5-alpha-L-arabinosidase [Goekera deserti]